MLSNGSFEHGLDRWFVTSDEHLAWRAKNTPIQIAFEQGALGILAWLVVSVAAVTMVLRSSMLPGATAACAAAMIGFVAVGCFDSLLDSPRLIAAPCRDLGGRAMLQIHRQPGALPSAATIGALMRKSRSLALVAGIALLCGIAAAVFLAVRGQIEPIEEAIPPGRYDSRTGSRFLPLPENPFQAPRVRELAVPPFADATSSGGQPDAIPAATSGSAYRPPPRA